MAMTLSAKYDLLYEKVLAGQWVGASARPKERFFEAGSLAERDLCLGAIGVDILKHLQFIRRI